MSEQPFRQPTIRATSPDAARRKEVARLRTLMPEPDAVYLATVRDGPPGSAGFLRISRWLTDRYALLNVTDSLAILDGPDDLLPDGEYRLTAGKGLVKAERHTPPDVAGWFAKHARDLASANWAPVHATGWTYVEDGWRALLVYAEVVVKDDPLVVLRQPFGVDYETWESWAKAYDGNDREERRAVWQKDPDNASQPFRVSLEGKAGDVPRFTVGYHKPWRVPAHEGMTAQVVADLHARGVT